MFLYIYYHPRFANANKYKSCSRIRVYIGIRTGAFANEGVVFLVFI